MNVVEVSTVVYAPREEIYAFLTDFTGYGQYSTYVEGIERAGDGGPGTEYDITVSWWKLQYTATSEVTATDRPSRIDWRLVEGVDAHGHWRIKGAEKGECDEDGEGSKDGGGGDGPGHRVVLRIEYDPDSVSGDALSLPAFVPLDAVVERVAPHVESEAESIVEDVVADLEGERRPVELVVHERPDEV